MISPEDVRRIRARAKPAYCYACNEHFVDRRSFVHHSVPSVAVSETSLIGAQCFRRVELLELGYSLTDSGALVAPESCVRIDELAAHRRGLIVEAYAAAAACLPAPVRGRPAVLLGAIFAPLGELLGFFPGGVCSADSSALVPESRTVNVRGVAVQVLIGRPVPA